MMDEYEQYAAIMDPVLDLPDDDPRKIEAREKAKPLAEKALAILKARRPGWLDLPRRRPRGCCSRHLDYDWTVRIMAHPNEQDLERMRADQSVPDEE